MSRGFFYKNPVVRKEISRALEQQDEMPDPRRNILDMAMNSEIELLRQKKEALEAENKRNNICVKHNIMMEKFVSLHYNG
uniref:DUF6262 family protein n=1 Tax=Enterocloster clostridioformis TaxID=1531 RepID=UPI002ED3A881